MLFVLIMSHSNIYMIKFVLEETCFIHRIKSYLPRSVQLIKPNMNSGNSSVASFWCSGHWHAWLAPLPKPCAQWPCRGRWQESLACYEEGRLAMALLQVLFPQSACTSLSPHKLKPAAVKAVWTCFCIPRTLSKTWIITGTGEHYFQAWVIYTERTRVGKASLDCGEPACV